MGLGHSVVGTCCRGSLLETGSQHPVATQLRTPPDLTAKTEVTDRIAKKSEDFSLLVAFLLVTFSWFFRGFFVALFCLEKQCSGLFRYFFVAFSWPPFCANFTRTRPGTVF